MVDRRKVQRRHPRAAAGLIAYRSYTALENLNTPFPNLTRHLWIKIYRRILFEYLEILVL